MNEHDIYICISYICIYLNAVNSDIFSVQPIFRTLYIAAKWLCEDPSMKWLKTMFRIIWQGFNHEFIYDPLTCNVPNTTSLLPAPMCRSYSILLKSELLKSLSTLTFIKSFKWLLCDVVQSGSQRILLCDPGNSRSRLDDGVSLTRGDCVIHLGKCSTDLLIRQRCNSHESCSLTDFLPRARGDKALEMSLLFPVTMGNAVALGGRFLDVFLMSGLSTNWNQGGQITRGQSIAVTNNLDAQVLIDTSFNKPAWVDLNKIPPLISMLYH